MKKFFFFVAAVAAAMCVNAADLGFTIAGTEYGVADLKKTITVGGGSVQILELTENYAKIIIADVDYDSPSTPFISFGIMQKSSLKMVEISVSGKNVIKTGTASAIKMENVDSLMFKFNGADTLIVENNCSSNFATIIARSMFFCNPSTYRAYMSVVNNSTTVDSRAITIGKHSRGTSYLSIWEDLELIVKCNAGKAAFVASYPGTVVYYAESGVIEMNGALWNNTASTFKIDDQDAKSLHFYSGEEPQGVRSLKTATPVVKKMVNGQLIIERDGHLFNALGAQL